MSPGSAFLTDHAGTLQPHPLISSQFPLPTKGTVQDSKLSPTLFNTALIPIAWALLQTPTVHNALYTDITVWISQDSDAHIQHTLQLAATTITATAVAAGLPCSLNKSQLLLLPPTYRPKKWTPNTQVALSGSAMPLANQIEILGLTTNRIDSTHTPSTYSRLTQTKYRDSCKVGRLIFGPRVHGPQESKRLKITHALFTPRIRYS
ncbi:hypothetical protein HPB48_014139 [Haemaphysalis longicornis]|uniref:Reverse transcriptase domain-containing protein n=1 Tax=Haemaphysalis longicornis TaxID=44386 RepID=A0A9J6FJR8_HAELO|nr:hypothetical protein HPB48_014139 [Haemaphysalis longicornis]